MADNIIGLPTAAGDPLPKQRMRGKAPQGVIPAHRMQLKRRLRAGSGKPVDTARAEGGRNDEAREKFLAKARALLLDLHMNAGGLKGPPMEALAVIVKYEDNARPPYCGVIGTYRDDPTLLLSELAIVQSRCMDLVYDMRDYND